MGVAEPTKLAVFLQKPFSGGVLSNSVWGCPQRSAQRRRDEELAKLSRAGGSQASRLGRQLLVYSFAFRRAAFFPGDTLPSQPALRNALAPLSRGHRSPRGTRAASPERAVARFDPERRQNLPWNGHCGSHDDLPVQTSPLAAGKRNPTLENIHPVGCR